MIVWKGKGVLAPIVALLVGALFEYMGTAIFAERQIWMTGIGLIIAGILIWYMGRAFNANSEQVLVDETGREIKLGVQNTLFFIRMEYWGPVVLLLGLWYIVSSIFSL